jgi:hypothetical protein
METSPNEAPPPPLDPRKRLQELLAIPDRDRTDAEWDELVELEVQLAPGNRLSPGARRDVPAPTSKNFAGQQPKRQGQGPGQGQGQKPKHFAGQANKRRKPFVK